MWWSKAKQAAFPKAAEPYGEEAFALTCLALELAKADDDFADSERERLEGDLAHHFDLDAGEVAKLMTAAEEFQSQAVETFSFTKALRESLDEEGRVAVIETLWRIAYADGVLDGAEFAFMRTIPSALGIENHVSEAAKRRAISALGLE